jgi:hypothetical protein
MRAAAFQQQRRDHGQYSLGNAKPALSIGAVLPPQHEMDRDGGSRASASGRL